MDVVSSILAQQPAQGQGSPLATFLPMILIFAAMWFLIIAPQRKKQKQHQKMISELKSGAQVITAGGIYGTITNVKDDRFVVKIGENNKIEITKTSVATVLPEAE